MLGSEDSPIPSSFLSPNANRTTSESKWTCSNDDCVIENDLLYICKGVFSKDDTFYSNIIDQGGEVSSKLESFGEVFHSVLCTKKCESECIISAACGNLFKNKDRLYRMGCKMLMGCKNTYWHLYGIRLITLSPSPKIASISYSPASDTNKILA